MTTPAVPSYTGYRFPAEIISHAVWLYFRFPLSLPMVDELLAARGIIVSYETVRQWARKFGQGERQMKRFKSPGQAQRFLSAHDGINNLFRLRRHQISATQYRTARTQAFQVWAEVTGVAAAA